MMAAEQFIEKQGCPFNIIFLRYVLSRFISANTKNVDLAKNK